MVIREEEAERVRAEQARSTFGRWMQAHDHAPGLPALPAKFARSRELFGATSSSAVEMRLWHGIPHVRDATHIRALFVTRVSRVRRMKTQRAPTSQKRRV